MSGEKQAPTLPGERVWTSKSGRTAVTVDDSGATAWDVPTRRPLSETSTVMAFESWAFHLLSVAAAERDLRKAQEEAEGGAACDCERCQSNPQVRAIAEKRAALRALGVDP